nr:toll/interleukin-1 receptor domain-containing protein [uncultured Aquimarina sp.]
MKYDAFISYSHKADKVIAPALQKALHNIARPTFKLRALNVFRDETDLSASPQLWKNIENALKESKYFIFLASPIATKSPWVQKEIDWWLTNKSFDSLLICLTDGNFYWNDKNENTVKVVSNSLPNNLKKLLVEEPQYADLRKVKKSEDVSLRNPDFRKQACILAATIHGKTINNLIGEDIKQIRKAKNLRNFAIILLVSAFSLAIYMPLSERKARKNAELNYANGLAYKARRFIEEKRFGAASVLLTHAKSLTRTGEIFSTSLQLPTSLLISDTLLDLRYNTLNNLKSNNEGNAFIGIDNNQELVHYSLNNSKLNKINDLKYPRLKSYDFNNIKKEFWTLNDKGKVIKIDSNTIKHEVLSLPNLENYDIDIRFFRFLSNEEQALLALHNGSIYMIQNDKAKLLPMSKQNQLALEDVVIDYINEQLIVAWFGGVIDFYGLNDWKLKNTININNLPINEPQPLYHPRLITEKNTLLISSDGGSNKTFTIPLNSDTSKPILLNIPENTYPDFENGLIKFHPTENQVIIAHNTTILAYSTKTGKVTYSINTDNRIKVFSYDPTGKYLIVPYFSDKLGVFDSFSGKLIEVIDGFPESITGMAFSKNGHLMVAMENGLIRTFIFYKIPDFYSFNNSIQLINHNSKISSKGNFIAMPVPSFSIPEDGQQIIILDLYSGELLCLLDDAVIPQSKNKIEKLIFSPDDNFLLAYSRNLGVAIWDIRKKPKLIIPWRQLKIKNIQQIYFNPKKELEFSCITDNREKELVTYELKENKVFKKNSYTFNTIFDLALSVYSKKYPIPEQLLENKKDIINFKYNKNNTISLISKNQLYIWDPFDDHFYKIPFEDDFNLLYKKFDVSNDGKYLAFITPKSRNVNIEVYEISSGKRFTIINPNSSIYEGEFHKNFGLLDIAFSEDNESIFTFSQKNIIQHWGLFSPSSNQNATKITGLKMNDSNIVLSFD